MHCRPLNRSALELPASIVRREVLPCIGTEYERVGALSPTYDDVSGRKTALTAIDTGA